jgi:hypothetical protein
MDSAKDVLSRHGQKLHIHESHIRKIADGKFLVTHDLRDKHGRPPMDGQRDRREHSVDNVKGLAEHVAANPPEESAENPAEEAAESPAQEAAEGPGA